MQGEPQSQVSRFAAAMLTVLWACGCASMLFVVFEMHRPLGLIAASFALAYTAMWARIAIQALRLSWSDIAKPWRAR